MNLGLHRKVNYDVIKNAMSKHKYVLFSDEKAFNLNIIGIRADNPVSNSFDDLLYVRYRDYTGKIVEIKTEFTTDPGLYYLQNTLNKEGCAILKAGQYRGALKVGLHQGSYKALVQNGVFSLIRDFNKDATLDYDYDEIQFDDEKIVKGIDFNGNKRVDFYTKYKYLRGEIVAKEEGTAYAGINLHRSSSTGGLLQIGKYSAGCQVANIINDYNQLIEAADKAKDIFGNSFTYTLLNEWEL